MSKFVNLNQPFGVDRVKMPNTAPDKELTCDWIANALGYGYKGGVSGGDRRLFVKMIEKLDVAKKGSSDFLEINPIEEAFILKAFNQLTCSPQEAKWINLAEDAVKNAVTEKPEPGMNTTQSPQPTTQLNPPPANQVAPKKE